MVLVNLFASGGMWEEMAGAYKAMKGSQVWRTPGVSQIMADAKDPHTLLKDKMHPQWEAIYEMLDDTLVPQMMKWDCNSVSWLMQLQTCIS